MTTDPTAGPLSRLEVHGLRARINFLELELQRADEIYGSRIGELKDALLRMAQAVLSLLAKEPISSDLWDEAREIVDAAARGEG